MSALRVEVILFTGIYIDFSQATNEKVDLIPVIGFLGSWLNPTHLVVEIGVVPQKWAIPINELSQYQEVKLEGQEGIDLNFNYFGSDQSLTEAVVLKGEKNGNHSNN